MARQTNGAGRYNLHHDIERIKTAIASATKHARGNASKAFHDSYDNIKDKGTDFGDNVVDYTKKKPLKSLGIAVLAGLALGFLLRK